MPAAGTGAVRAAVRGVGRLPGGVKPLPRPC